MERMSYPPWMTQYITQNCLLANDPLCIIDVGASGGIASYWGVFGEFFKAFGFEPLIAECRRLNAEKSKPEHVVYYPYFVGSDNEEVSAEAGPTAASQVFTRTSAHKASELKKINFIQEHYNFGKDTVYTDKKISIDQFCSTHPIETVDFIKIDTDGYDYEVLHGAQKLLSNKQVLGITVEAQFHGKSHHHSNTFRNIDRMLTDMGFFLFDLEVYRYTKQDLPGMFSCSVAAQTTTGRALWGEALYFRDYALGNQPIGITPVKLLKLACLFELFGLPDCSAELLNVYREQLSSLVDVQKCLDLLVKDIGRESTYSEYIKQFENNFEDFYPSKQVQLRGKLSRFFKLNMESKKYYLSRFMKKICG